MSCVFELPIVKGIKEVEELASIIKEKKKKSEEFKVELEQLKRKCLKYNLRVQDYIFEEKSEKLGVKGLWG